MKGSEEMAKSIQAEPKRGEKNSTAKLQAATVRNAHRRGIAWEDYEVSLLANGIEKDKSTYEIAISLGRTYYSVMTARSHVRFALSHMSILEKIAK